MSNLKKLDKIIYTIILILGIITASIIFCFTLIGIMNAMNSMEFSEILIDMKIYPYFYKVLNVVDSFILPILFIIFFCAIPYLILSLILIVIFIIKYVKYREKKKNRIIKTVILSMIVAFILTNGFTIKSILLMIIGEGLYIYFLAYILREFKIISEKKDEVVQQETKQIKEKGKQLPLKTVLTLLVLVIFIIVLLFYLVRQNKIKDEITKDSNVIENTTDVWQREEGIMSGDTLYEKRVDDNIIIRVVYKEAVLAQRSIIGVRKSTDGGVSWKEQKEDLQIHNGAKFIFLDENIGFINDPGLAGTEGENRGLIVTTDGGKTFVDATIIHPSTIKEKNLFVSGLPYLEDGKLKVKIYTINHQKNPEKTYYEFYSKDNGLNWKYLN